MRDIFVMVPRNLLQLTEINELDAYHVAICYAIYAHFNEKDGRDYSWPSIKRIAKLSGCAKSTVELKIPKLIELNIFDVKKRFSKSTIYSEGNYEKANELLAEYHSIPTDGIPDPTDGQGYPIDGI